VHPHAPRHVCRFRAAASIRTTYEQEGELSAAIEVRRLFPGITDNASALECARAISGWKTAARGGLPDYPVTPSQEPGSADALYAPARCAAVAP
jgi:hypothetical protein